MNATITVNMERVTDVKLDVYLQPNNFYNFTFDTFGVQENNLFREDVREGTFEVPADWAVWLVYESPRGESGFFEFNTELKEVDNSTDTYERNDVWF